MYGIHFSGCRCHSYEGRVLHGVCCCDDYSVPTLQGQSRDIGPAYGGNRQILNKLNVIFNRPMWHWHADQSFAVRFQYRLRGTFLLMTPQRGLYQFMSVNHLGPPCITCLNMPESIRNRNDGEWPGIVSVSNLLWHVMAFLQDCFNKTLYALRW